MPFHGPSGKKISWNRGSTIFPIISKLSLVVIVFVLIIGALITFSFFGMEALSSIRAYVGGEGLWSKAQKDAVYQLNTYVLSRDESDFAKYRQFIAVPMGDKKARLELEKPNPDLDLADQGFLEGGNHPEDVRGLSLLFIRFRHVSYIDRAISIWEEGDTHIAQLDHLADMLHEAVSSGRATDQEIAEILRNIDHTNTKLTTLENDFSSTLGEGARWLTALLIGTMFTVSGLLLFFGLMVSYFILRDVARVDRAKTEFIALTSHQLRTPPTGIKWYTAMLLDEDVGKLLPDQRKYLDQVAYNNQRMIDVVDTVLNVSQIELGTFQNKPIPTDVCAVIDKLLAGFNFEFKSRKITLFRHYECGTEFMLIDPALLRIVVYNLISNAIKYTPEGGTVTLVVVLSGSSKLTLTVTDTGHGIPKGDFTKIFREFFRASNVQAEYSQGLGLGLYIVRRILDQINGTIGFTSELGKGTTFSVAIPVSIKDKGISP